MCITKYLKGGECAWVEGTSIAHTLTLFPPSLVCNRRKMLGGLQVTSFLKVCHAGSTILGCTSCSYNVFSRYCDHHSFCHPNSNLNVNWPVIWTQDMGSTLVTWGCIEVIGTFEYGTEWDLFGCWAQSPVLSGKYIRQSHSLSYQGP